MMHLFKISPMPVGHPPSRCDVLQLYRELLRAATYLPESSLRQYAHNHIRERFRRSFKAKLEAGKLGRIYKDAKSNLRRLQRAGACDHEALKHVMELAYGRKGKRRRELVNDLLRTTDNNMPPAKEQESTDMHTFVEELAEPTKTFTPSPKLLAFINSQLQNHPPESERHKIRRATPSIEEKNLWGRPLPIKLEASKRAKFWAKTLNSILPPLPPRDWDRLRDLATGVIPYEKPVPLRPSGSGLWLQSLNDQTQWIHNPARISSKDLELDSETGQMIYMPPDYKQAEIIRWDLSPRAFRRLWGNIWAQSPKMVQDESTKKWIVTWGKGVGKTLSGEITQPSMKDLELFEGLESASQEKKPRKKRAPKPPKITA